MIESRNIQAILYFFLIVIVLEGDSRRPRLREEKPSEKRDYRPSKWVSNSAMDVWYGNKSMVDILSREFSDIMNRIANRPVRSPVPTEETSSDVTKLTEYNLVDQGTEEMISDKIKLIKHNPVHKARKDISPEVTKLIEHHAAEEAITIILRTLNETISKVISNVANGELQSYLPQELKQVHAKN